MIHKLEPLKQAFLTYYMTKETLSVSELTNQIKKNLESSFGFVAVKGEISNFRAQTSGHFYFTLKDKEAQIFCALFRSDASKLKKPPKDGDFVTLQGEISVFPPKGNYQLIVRALQLEGLGDLLAQFQERKARLLSLGWFDASAKKKISAFPKVIGVVTSPTGAVIQDIIHVLTRRHKGFHLLLNPVLVQGVGAKEQIAKAIKDFNTHKLADVLIVGRGGGSLEDLWAFNEEIVAEAIYRSEIPIISAVGHETDFSIADFVADIRAPTPSAAAELVACDKKEVFLRLEVFRKRILAHITTLVQNFRRILVNTAKRPELTSASKLFKEKYLKMDQLEEKLEQSMRYSLREKRSILSQFKARLDIRVFQEKRLAASQKMLVLEKNLKTCLLQTLLQKKQCLTHLSAHLSSIDPKTLLQKGYAIVFKDQTVVVSAKQTQNKDLLKIRFSDGTVIAQTQETFAHE